MLLFFAGLVFSLLWSSASIATKIALQSAQPFIICIIRFFIAGTLMLVTSHLVMKNRLPQKKEWKQLVIYGLLNISVYLGLYVIAMQYVSPGLGSLSVAVSPVFISLLSALVLGKTIHRRTLISLLLCTAGVVLAAYPLFINSYASPVGLVIILVSMIVYSGGVIYYAEKNWNGLHILTMNGWQTMLGGIFLLPLAAITYHPAANSLNLQFACSIIWLAIPVSIFAIQLWLLLLKNNPVKASFWLFFCPVSGFVMANAFMEEPIGIYTVAGVLLVLTGLFYIQKNKT